MWEQLIGMGVEQAGSALQQWRNEEMAGKAWDRTKKLYQRRYQWMMSDMEAAGLNPILAYQQGAGGTPSAPVAQTVNPTAGTAANVRAAVQQRQELKNLESQNKLMREQWEKTRQDTYTGIATESRERTQAYLNEANERLAEAEAQRAASSAKQMEAQADWYRVQARLGRLEVPGKEVEAAIDSSAYGVATRAVDRLPAGVGALMRPRPAGRPPIIIRNEVRR